MLADYFFFKNELYIGLPSQKAEFEVVSFLSFLQLRAILHVPCGKRYTHCKLEQDSCHGFCFTPFRLYIICSKIFHSFKL